MKVTKAIVSKVLETVDTGLSSGLGKPIPGQMCVEAAVCYALGQDHGDNPECVAPSLRVLKIALNDFNWSTNDARAKGLRRLAVLQLGTAGNLDEVEFVKKLALLSVNFVVPRALRNAASLHPILKQKVALEEAAKVCEAATFDSANSAAYSARSAAYSAANSAANSAADSARDSAADSARDSAANSAANSAAYSAYSAANSVYSADSVHSAADSAYSARDSARSARSAADSARSAAYSTRSAAGSVHSAADSAGSVHSAADSVHSAADSARSAAYSAAYDTELAAFAEQVVQLLISMNVPAVKYLGLTE